MRIKPRQHTLDCRLNQLCIVRLLDIVRAHALEYVAEKAEVLERLSGCLCARCLDHCPGLRTYQRHGSARALCRWMALDPPGACSTGDGGAEHIPHGVARES